MEKSARKVNSSCMFNASVVCPVYRCLHSLLGTKSFIRLYLTHVTFCSTQKRGNRFSFSLFLSPPLLFLIPTVLFVYSVVPCVWVLQGFFLFCPHQVFDQYVKTRAEEERKEKKNKLMQAKDEFRRMMEEAKLTPR